MMEVKEIELGLVNGIVRIKNAKGTFKRSKYFSLITDKNIYWAEFELEYCGG